MLRGQRRGQSRLFPSSGSHEHLLGSIRAFAWMVPGEVRTYPMSQLDEAKAWLSET